MGALLVFLALTGLAGWAATDPEIRIALYQLVFRMSEERARQTVCRPVYLAALRALRIVGFLILLAVAILEAIHRPDLLVWFFVAGVGAVCLLTLYLGRRQTVQCLKEDNHRYTRRQ